MAVGARESQPGGELSDHATWCACETFSTPVSDAQKKELARILTRRMRKPSVLAVTLTTELKYVLAVIERSSKPQRWWGA